LLLGAFPNKVHSDEFETGCCDHIEITFVTGYEVDVNSHAIRKHRLRNFGSGKDPGNKAEKQKVPFHAKMVNQLNRQQVAGPDLDHRPLFLETGAAPFAGGKAYVIVVGPRFRKSAIAPAMSGMAQFNSWRINRLLRQCRDKHFLIAQVTAGMRGVHN
jgi:hypothetical protein